MPSSAIPHVHAGVPNWWYHYYSCAVDEPIRQVTPACFVLAPYKRTPDFEKYRYDYGICHYQIGDNVVQGKSIILLKTAIGVNNPAPGFIEKAQFITGYFRVASINPDKGYIEMDRDESLLLLDDPIRLDKNWVRKLFPEKPESYWSSNLVRKIGSITRNRHIHAAELGIALEELLRRSREGGTNYMGNKYRVLCDQVPNK